MNRREFLKLLTVLSVPSVTLGSFLKAENDNIFIRKFGIAHNPFSATPRHIGEYHNLDLEKLSESLKAMLTK